MSQQQQKKLAFDYSKWDNIELSDDEDDVHPNIDRESWFRMKHRSRVEREDNESKDRKNVEAEMAKATKRMEIIQHDLHKLAKEQAAWEASKRSAAGGSGGDDKDDDSEDDDDDDDEFDARREALEVELRDLQNKNAVRQARLDEYDKNKKWNVDNMFEVKDERTFISPTAGTTTYTDTGYVKPKEQLEAEAAKPAAGGSGGAGVSIPAGKATAAAAPPAPLPVASSSPAAAKPVNASASSSSSSVDDSGRQLQSLTVSPAPPPVELGAMETYQQFTDKYADTVELFMSIPDLEGSKTFLLRYGDIILQENASNYLLLASLEDEMNGHRDKMHRTARQSQIVTSIAELAKTLKTHPGNVIEPFFARLQQREHLEEFLRSVKDFQDKIVKRAITKRQEMDAARAIHAQEAEDDDDGPRDLSSVPREERLGPGGLDPLEVIETLPEAMVAAFESRDVDNLRAALEKLTPEEAEYHMKRCVDSGLWVANAQG